MVKVMSESLAAGEILTEVELSGTTTFRQLIRKVDLSVHHVVMAVGDLVRQGLLQASQRGQDLVFEAIVELPGEKNEERPFRTNTAEHPQ